MFYNHKMKEVNAKINVLEQENAELDESLARALKTTLKLRKSVSHLKIQNRKVNEKFNSQPFVQSLKDQISFSWKWKMWVGRKNWRIYNTKSFFFWIFSESIDANEVLWKKPSLKVKTRQQDSIMLAVSFWQSLV